MKAIVLNRRGKAKSAFELKAIEKPIPKDDEILIKVQYTGLNFADVMIRKGLYDGAPPLPCIIGFDVSGIVEQTGKQVKDFNAGDRVLALTRFGGYAEYVCTKSHGAIKVPESMKLRDSTALATQYCTAYYAAAEMTSLHPGDRVLIHSGAGGLGTALIQYATHRGCTIFSTAGSEEKINYLKSLGVQHAIQYNSQDFEKEIKQITNNEGVDVIFDGVGGSSVRKGIRSLRSGGRIVCHGASKLSSSNIFGKLLTVIQFGLYHPIQFMMSSKSLIGINMLNIADYRPDVIQRVFKQVIELADKKIFIPHITNEYPPDEIATAHDLLESRKSIGKIVIRWKD